MVEGVGESSFFRPCSSFAHASHPDRRHKTAVLTGGEQMTGPSERRAYCAGTGVAVVTSFLTVWTTVVRDDGNGFGFFMLIMAAVVGAFSAWFRPAGMARTMLGVAVMQVLLGIAFATDPSIASTPDGGFKILVACGTFTALWLMSAAFFRAAAKRKPQAAAAR
jgi:hypothetical protein